jgi:hypothetical protein
MSTMRAAVIGLSAFIAACTQAPHPTGPSALALPPDQQFTQFAASRLVEWNSLIAARNAAATVVAADAPTAPSNLAFTVSGSTVTLTWSASGSNNATRYVLEAGSGSTLSDLARFDTDSTATTLTVTNVPDGTYFVRVRARNADGSSAASNEVVIIVGKGGQCPSPPAPTGLMGTYDGDTLTISWNAVPEAISYILEAGRTRGASDVAVLDTGSSETYYRIRGINGEYWIRVRVRTGCGLSESSTDVYIYTYPTSPPSVTGRWVGSLTSDSDIINCPTTVSVDMTLTANGGSVSGTAHTQITSVRYTSCSNVLGFIAAYGVSGTMAPDGSIAFSFGNSGAYAFTGTVTGNRITGRYSGQNGRGTFALTKQ